MCLVLSAAYSNALMLPGPLPSSPQVLVSMCRTVAIIEAANSALQLAGSHELVPKIEDGINDNLAQVRRKRRGILGKSRRPRQKVG